MALLKPHYALAKQIGSPTVDIEAQTVGELIKIGSEKFGEVFSAELKKAAIMVNGRNIIYLKGKKTPLAADDEVATIIPAAGG